MSVPWASLVKAGCLTLALVLLGPAAVGAAIPEGRPPLNAQAGTPPAPPQAKSGQESNPPEQFKLAPEKRAKAIAYARTRYFLYFFSAALNLGVCFFLWRARIAQTFRNWARTASSRLTVQCLIFAPLFFVVVSLIQLPLDYYSGFVLEQRYGLSTQSLGSWTGDWLKGLFLTIIISTAGVWILFTAIRRSARRWWFYFWLVSMPLTLGLILIEPLVIDPLFFKFTPLEDTRPALVARIELMLHRANLEIPTSRIFEMNASTKTNAVNAYVNGIGASKRVVIWDTTLKLMSEDETLLVLGHETGHYVLGHVARGFVIFELGALVAFGLGYLIVDRMIKRWGPGSGLEGVGDLAALPVLLIVLNVLTFLSSPIYNGISRQVEHQADQFGLEVAYGVVPDPNAAEVRSLQILGEQDLADPAPPALIKIWLYSHPPLDERIRFATSYKPWAEGKQLELVHPR